MTLKSRFVMGRVRPRLLFQSNALAKNKSPDSSKVVLPAAKRLHVLDYWEELLGSPDDALRAEDQTTRPTKCEVPAISVLGQAPKGTMRQQQTLVRAMICSGVGLHTKAGYGQALPSSF